MQSGHLQQPGFFVGGQQSYVARFAVACLLLLASCSQGGPQAPAANPPPAVDAEGLEASFGVATFALSASCSLVGYTPATSLKNVIQVDVGASPLIVLSDNTLRAFGTWASADNMTAVRSVSSSDTHALINKTDGTVAAVGSGFNPDGELTVPGGLTTVIQVAAGTSKSYALRANGTVAAWGQIDGLKAVQKANGATGITAITAFGNLAAGIKSDGTVSVFVDTALISSLKPPTGLNQVVQIGTTGQGYVALKSDGTLVGWSSNSAAGDPAAFPPAGLTGVVTFVVNDYDGCAILNTGSVTCWGYAATSNSFAALRSATDVWKMDFYGSTVVYNTCPGCKAIPPIGCCDGDTLRTCTDTGIVSSTCAANTCGSNGSNGFACDQGGATLPGLNHATCAAGVCVPSCTDKGCGDDGCGGTCGTCPNGSTCDAPSGTCTLPAVVPTSCEPFAVDLVTSRAMAWKGGSTAQIVDYQAGLHFAIARRSDGTVSYAGTAPGTLGAAITGGSLTGVRAIAAGSYHALFVLSDDTVVAYGDATKVSAAALTVPGDLGPVMAVAAGSKASFALQRDRKVRAWGTDTNGKTNTVTTANNKTDFVTIAAAGDMAMGKKSDGSVYGFDIVDTQLATAGGSVGIATDGFNYYVLKPDGSVVSGGNINAAYPAPEVYAIASAITGGVHAFAAFTSDGKLATYITQMGAYPSLLDTFLWPVVNKSTGFSNARAERLVLGRHPLFGLLWLDSANWLL